MNIGRLSYKRKRNKIYPLTHTKLNITTIFFGDSWEVYPNAG